ncbi:MAG: Asp-tRNA(Asn)/Glu-tRNA(Gln) amidotransferase subunit GatC [Deltaproteobacteria bacterium]|nr:Asp-tRNA(Asn)/Glu-tRNA(Gln) amidotransferase subunit GatC [Deltaproteobacteria bacterium]
MKISPEEVAHVAALARLELTPEMQNLLTGQMNDILTYMDKLAELDTQGVPPTNHALELTGALREDRVRESLPREEALANAPEENGDSFVVPRVI